MTITPKARRKAAAALLFATLVVTPINVVLYRPLHIIDTDALILVTLVLSWLAITLTAADIWATTDVRAEQEEP